MALLQFSVVWYLFFERDDPSRLPFLKLATATCGWFGLNLIGILRFIVANIVQLGRTGSGSGGVAGTAVADAEPSSIRYDQVK